MIHLSQQHVGDEHDAKADQQCIRGTALTTMSMRLGNHFIADDVQHSTACKGKCKGQDSSCNADGEIPDQRANHLNQSGQHRANEGLARGDASRQHGANDDHTLGHVLKRDAARNNECLRNVTCTEADARSKRVLT